MVLFDTLKLKSQNQNIGLIELNRPKAINSLNLEMVELLLNQLNEWEQNSDIDALLIYSQSPKGFCAGGDVKKVVLSLSENPSYAERFFEVEYQVDQKIFNYPKPITCLGHGIVMGGGMGLFMASSRRIVTSTSILAMPETAIGFFPDVGASFFLNRLPNFTGYFLALSGYRLNGAEAHQLGLATHYIDHANDLFSDLEKVLSVGSSFSEKPLDQEFFISCQSIFSQDSLSQCISQWEASSHPILQSGYESFQKNSYHAAQVIWEQLRLSKSLDRQEVTCFEMNLAKSFLKSEDFREGVRAQLIDKDKKPLWQKEPLSQKEINGYFSAAM